ncbi:hypothetical protein FRX31_018066 [Thalictrum thalictroides]|uniref:Uncharacterized protein n=1 Tax=Thalictrum thalictroides TaxID=46969 RepID=A0A7J6W6D4_THATH|nr:hypothetical protein FRX31_018066 [Thalictrum thalictroides]
MLRPMRKSVGDLEQSFVIHLLFKLPEKIICEREDMYKVQTECINPTSLHIGMLLIRFLATWYPVYSEFLRTSLSSCLGCSVAHLYANMRQGKVFVSVEVEDS